MSIADGDKGFFDIALLIHCGGSSRIERTDRFLIIVAMHLNTSLPTFSSRKQEANKSACFALSHLSFAWFY